jgi:prevent-host-death family protein
MAVEHYDSRTARVKFRDMLEASRKGIDIIIEHYRRPTSVLIPYEDYVALEEELEDLRAGRRAAALLEEWERDPSVARPYEEVREELKQAGLLDE